MNIYIPIEVKTREIESRTLLALAAAERGLVVVLGGKEDGSSHKCMHDSGMISPITRRPKDEE